MLLETVSETYIFVEAKPGETFRWHKTKIKVDPLIGAQFGARFEIRNGELVKMSRREDLLEDAAGQADNRDYHDNNTAQRVDHTAIAQMRKDGVSGEDIIESLVQGSRTWDQKTEFAKEKYLKRKQRKYLPWIRILVPRGATIARAYFHKGNAKKHLLLRPDAIAQMLTRGNIRSGIDVLCVDGSGGILTGTIIERNVRRVFSPYVETFPPSMDALQRFNFPKPTISTTLRQVRLGCHDTTTGDDEYRALVIASKHDPLTVLKAMLPLLRPSSPFVVYCDAIDPLLPSFKHLQTESDVVAVHLTEAWVRDFQVLPNRTHPTMTVSATGGFLLSGIKVLPQDDDKL